MTLDRTPIGDYGLIGDTRSAALVSPSGSIDWMCVPRFDSPPIFGRLVGGGEAGFFSVAPTDQIADVARAYRGDTTTLETTWSLDGATLCLADSMIAEVAGRLLPSTVLVRRLTASMGPVDVTMRFAPRFGYRRSRAMRWRRYGAALVVEHRGLAVTLEADADGEPSLDEAVRFTVDPSRPVTVVVSATHRGPATFVPPATAASLAERDERGWQQWADGIEFDGSHRRHVVRSLLTLQLLTYSPSGAPVAAPTTSLPERLGGSRNWDYRYAWPRDASIGIGAFLGVGKRREARSFLAWLRHASRLARPRLPALFTLDGRPAPDEEQLTDWPGYADSRPVRVGNGATDQHQLDGYGWVLDAAWLLAASGERLDAETWRIMRGFAGHVVRRWREPDAGIWERRDAPRHNVHSKLMAWLALDRAAMIAERRGGRAAQRATTLREERDRVGDSIRERGFNDDIGAYTAAYGSTDLDAAVLILPLIGIEPPESPRVRATIDAIRSQLGAGGPLLFRYLDDDGLPGSEGAFLPCSFWLVQALARTGRVDDARATFAELMKHGGALGLYAEEIDVVTHEHLGNFPQALTHAALLQAALALGDCTPST
jgi:GH15 family glucan-1,4-alpha-glucosidase